MKKSWNLVAALAFAMANALAFASTNAKLAGDYVEVRTASVFAGACHYNGELTTTGRDAMLAWNVASGSWRGVDLAGVRALAIVSAEDNLANLHAARRSELLIDAATEAQASAMAEALRSKYASTLGQIVSIRRAPIAFKHEGRTYHVSAAHLAKIDVAAMPNDECCKMPHLVWYDPLVPLAHRKVGYTIDAFFAGGSTGDSWLRAGENSAFYGQFAI